MSQQIRISKYHPSYLPDLMDICRLTSDNGSDGTRLFTDPNFIGRLYMLPYVIFDPASCFVATLNDIPAGYILGAVDSTAYYNWMEDYYLNPIRARYPVNMKTRSSTEAFFLELAHRNKRKVQISSDFPAHLHINLLPSIRSRGYGRILIESFMRLLKENQIPGVYLHTNRENSGAVNFFKHTGFEEIMNMAATVKLGYKLPKS